MKAELELVRLNAVDVIATSVSGDPRACDGDQECELYPITSMAPCGKYDVNA